MEKEKHDESRQISLALSEENLRFLKPVKGSKFSKLDALFDLVNRAAKDPVTVTLYGQVYNLNPGELLCTISDLANSWNWMRNTVSSYLKNLQTQRLVTVTARVKTFQVEVIALMLDSSIKTCAQCLMQLKKNRQEKLDSQDDKLSDDYAEKAAKMSRVIDAILGDETDPDKRAYSVFARVIGHLTEMTNPKHAAAILGLILSSYPGGSDALAKDLASIYACHGHKPAGQSKSKTELWLDMLAEAMARIEDCDSYAAYAADTISLDRAITDNIKAAQSNGQNHTSDATKTDSQNPITA